jgi:hypothetical protein
MLLNIWSNNHAIAFMMIITAMMLGENPISWAESKDTCNYAAVSKRVKRVNQAVIAPIDEPL